eukprot:6455326-Amphidinium_carterae.1
MTAVEFVMPAFCKKLSSGKQEQTKGWLVSYPCYSLCEVACEWQLSNSEKAWGPQAVFLGMMLGAPFWGWFEFLNYPRERTADHQ